MNKSEFTKARREQLINTYTFDEIDDFINKLKLYRMLVSKTKTVEDNERFNILLEALMYGNVVGIICTVLALALFTLLYCIVEKTPVIVFIYFLGVAGFIYGITLLSKRNIELGKIKKFAL